MRGSPPEAGRQLEKGTVFPVLDVVLPGCVAWSRGPRLAASLRMKPAQRMAE